MFWLVISRPNSLTSFFGIEPPRDYPAVAAMIVFDDFVGKSEFSDIRALALIAFVVPAPTVKFAGPCENCLLRRAVLANFKVR